MSKPKFEILPSSDGQFFVNLVAPNGEILNTSETLKTKQACITNIEAVKNYAAEAVVFDTTE